MAEFDPRLNFRKYHKAEAEVLMVQANERWFNIALQAALSELVCSGADDSEMKGARAFITILKNLTEDEAPTQLPIKRLEVLGRDPVPTPPSEPDTSKGQPAKKKGQKNG